jgi:hypothetical protein
MARVDRMLSFRSQSHFASFAAFTEVFVADCAPGIDVVSSSAPVEEQVANWTIIGLGAENEGRSLPVWSMNGLKTVVLVESVIRLNCVPRSAPRTEKVDGKNWQSKGMNADSA